MSNSVIKRELTALLQDKEHFDFLRHQRILVTGATGTHWLYVYKNCLYLPMRHIIWI